MDSARQLARLVRDYRGARTLITDRTWGFMQKLAEEVLGKSFERGT